MKKQVWISLVRQYHEHGTNGTLYYQGKPICQSIELPWRSNTRRISCIPEGIYLLSKQVYARFGEQIGLPEVPGRSGILIHAANHARTELQGCIAPVSRLTGPGQGLQSRIALAKLKALVYALWDQGYQVYLQIRALGQMPVHQLGKS